MRNLLALLAAGLIFFVIVGWYQGWYRVQSAPSTQGNPSYNVEINKDKITNDLHKGTEKLQETLEKRQSNQPTENKKDPSSAAAMPDQTDF